MPGFNIGLFQPQCELDLDNSNPGRVGRFSGGNLPSNMETARRNRFELEISRDGSLFSEYFSASCESIDRPIVRITNEKIWNGTDYINVPLRAEYDPINVTFYEYTGDTLLSDGRYVATNNNTASYILSWWTKSSFNSRRSRSSFPEARRTTVIIKQLDGYGLAIWSYKLYSCWPQVITPDRLDYKDSDICKIQVTLVFDKFEEVKD